MKQASGGAATLCAPCEPNEEVADLSNWTGERTRVEGEKRGEVKGECGAKCDVCDGRFVMRCDAEGMFEIRCQC